MTISMSTFGNNGRFGNQIFQYFFLKILQIELNEEIMLPAWFEQDIFETPVCDGIENRVRIDVNLEQPSGRDCGPDVHLSMLKDIKNINNNFDINISGYFQYHTSTIIKYKQLFLDTFFINLLVRSTVESALLKLNPLSKKIIGIHVRRGDYLLFGESHDYIWTASMNSVVKTIADLLMGGYSNAIIYLATDDPQYVEDQFQARGIPFISNKHLKNDTANISELACDFEMLARADVLLISNSTLSFAASLINRKSKIFLRPSPTEDRFLPFDPWNSHVLLSRGKYVD